MSLPWALIISTAIAGFTTFVCFLGWMGMKEKERELMERIAMGKPDGGQDSIRRAAGLS